MPRLLAALALLALVASCAPLSHAVDCVFGSVLCP
jgi:hypothetical protein